MLGYRSPFSNQWKVQIEGSSRTTFSIHVNWDEASHGLSNSLSDDHLELIMQEAGFDFNIERPLDSLNTNNTELSTPTTMLTTDHHDLEAPSTSHHDLEAPSTTWAAESALDLTPSIPNPVPYVSIEPLPDIALFEQPSPAKQADDSSARSSPVATYYGHNQPNEICTDNILEVSRRQCNHTTVLNKARTLLAAKEVPMKEALSSEARGNWLEAIDKEMKALQEHIAVQIFPDDKVYQHAMSQATPSRILLTEKRDGRKKARWVVQGCFESTDLDDFSNYANVATLNAVRCCIFRHDRRRCTLATVDICTAFLQSNKYEPDEPQRWITVRDPTQTKKTLLFELMGPMYGQRSAPVRWQTTLAPWLVSQGFIQGDNEPCVFHRHDDDLLVLVYVDDLLLDGDEAVIRTFLDVLQRRFKINEPAFLTPSSSLDFIGILISLTDTTITLSMEAYCSKLLSTMEMDQCRPVGTPIINPVNESELLDSADASKFRSGLGGIGWLANTTRPDLAYAFSRLGQHLAKPTVSAQQGLKHALRYIQGTKSLALTMPLDQEENTFDFYADSDHAGNSETQNQRRSQTGYVCRLNQVPVMWKSTVQSITATSSTEAEIYAASTAVQNFVYLSYVISEMKLSGFPLPFDLFVDNAAAEAFMGNTTKVSRIKHIDVRLNWVKQLRDRGIVIPCSVNSTENLADIFTKILAKPTFLRILEALLTRR